MKNSKKKKEEEEGENANQTLTLDLLILSILHSITEHKLLTFGGRLSGDA